MKKESYFYVSVINGCLYHIEASPYYNMDEDMACLLKLNLKDYRNLLVEKFQGISHYGEIYFKDKHNLKKALIYLDELYECILVMRKLSGE